MKGRFSRSGGCDVLLSTGSLFIKLSRLVLGFFGLVLVLLGWRGPGMGLLYFTLLASFTHFFPLYFTPLLLLGLFFPVRAVFIHHVDFYLIFQKCLSTAPLLPIFHLRFYFYFIFPTSISTSLHLLTA